MKNEESRGRIEDRTIRFTIFHLLSVLFALSLAGCAGYHLGAVDPGARAGDRSIEVIPFHNQTLEPRLSDAVTQAMRERLQRDGTYRLATHDDADVTLTGTITGYSRKAVSFLRSDVITARNYRIEAIVHVVARDRVSGKVLLDKNVNGYTLIRIGTDLADAQRQSLPLLASDLARNVVEQLTEGAW